MNIINVVEGIEKLIVELLTWIVLIPRTLRKILENPQAVPGYIDEELAKPSGRFENYISPVLLFLICSVVLYFVDAQIVQSDLALSDRADRFAKALQGINASGLAFAFLGLPLFLGVVTHATMKTDFTGDWLKRVLYIQCCYCAPLTLGFFSVSLGLSGTYEVSAFRTAADNVLLLLFIAILTWFLVAEIQLLRRERAMGVLGASVTLGLTLVGFLIVLGFVASAFEDSEGPIDDEFGGHESLIDYPLPATGRYTVVVTAFSETSSRYRVSLGKIAEGGSGIDCSTIAAHTEATNATTLEYGDVVEGELAVRGEGRLTFSGVAGERIYLSVDSVEGEETDADLTLDVLDAENEQTVIKNVLDESDRAFRDFIPYIFVTLYVVVIGWAAAKGIYVNIKESAGAKALTLIAFVILGLGAVSEVHDVASLEDGGEPAVLCLDPASAAGNSSGG